MSRLEGPFVLNIPLETLPTEDLPPRYKSPLGRAYSKRPWWQAAWLAQWPESLNVTRGKPDKKRETGRTDQRALISTRVCSPLGMQPRSMESTCSRTLSRRLNVCSVGISSR
ncbi:hypothetical protein KC315_g20 [Hortaea werneckii]|nr:hypothetical protein KC315_g20 [Hortaea werneckii]